MAKNQINARLVENLNFEIDQHKREKQELRRENDSLRQQNMMLRDAMTAITEDESFWSEQAVKSGIVWRLKNVIQNISN